jgi:hypothetical protein
MAHVIISDLEEFVVNPFGPIHFSEIPAGIYSQLGHEMVNRAEGTSWSYQETIWNITQYILNQTMEEYLEILGYQKENGSVLNLVNHREFCESDSEYFLCKAWLIAKLTFGHNQISKYPKQCNNYTHPSPVIHRCKISAIQKTMEFIEEKYMELLGQTDSIILPNFCVLPRETFQ